MSATGPAAPRGRLLYIVNETFFFYSHRLPVARAARDAGYEVHVAAPDDHVWAPADFDIAALTAEGFVYHRIPLRRRGTNPFQEAATFLALLRLVRRLRPALVHTLTIKPVIYGGLAARLSGVPGLVSAVTGLGQVFTARDLKHRLIRPLVVLAYRAVMAGRSGRVIVQNPDDGARLVAEGCLPQDRLRLIRGSGVDLEEFSATPEEDGAPLFVLPARLIWEKGVGEFVEAARRLRADGRVARFALIGNTAPSNPRAVPEATLRAWHEEGVIEWWGRRTDMPAIFAACHGVCLPSTYGEGVPKVLIEAASSGRAIVTTDIAGCREIVRDGVNGLLVPPGDVAALTAALGRLIDDPGERRRLGGNGPGEVAAGFSATDVVRQTLDVYAELREAGAG